jgi:hypothetical protein
MCSQHPLKFIVIKKVSKLKVPYTSTKFFNYFFCRNRILMVSWACNTRFLKNLFDSAEIFNISRVTSASNEIVTVYAWLTHAIMGTGTQKSLTKMQCCGSGMLFPDPNFSIHDQKDCGYRIRIHFKELSTVIFTQWLYGIWIWLFGKIKIPITVNFHPKKFSKYNLDFLPIPDPGSRGSKRHWIQIRKTVKLPFSTINNRSKNRQKNHPKG